MWHHYTLTVPADTAEADPAEKTMVVTAGVVKYIGVVWPRGVKAMVGVRIYRWEHQIFPNNPDEAARGDGAVEGGEVHLPLTEPPFILKARGDSPGTTYDHDIPILINILPVEAAEPWRAEDPVLKKVARFLGIGG
jgi:hypothetical protein